MPNLQVVQAENTVWRQLVADFLQEKRAIGASPRTVGHYEAVLLHLFVPFCVDRGIASPARLSSRDLNAFSVGHLDGTGSRSGRPLSKATLHSYMRVINSFLAWVREQGESVNAKAKLPQISKPVIDTLTREEIQAMEDSARYERDKLVVRLLADTGIRLGELRALRLEDIRTEGGRNVLRIRGKGDKERLVPITPGLARRLRRHGDHNPKDAMADRLFLTEHRSRKSGLYEAPGETAFEQMIRNLGERAGIKRRVYPHLLRHSFATDYLRRGGNPILLQQILGHSSLTMITRHYQHLKIADAHDELMNILLGGESRR